MTVTQIRPALHWRDVDWGRHQRWLDVGGRRANVIVAGPEDAEPIVFVHGLALNWQAWLLTIPPFMRSHRIVAVDLPGFGHSEMPREPISIPGQARFLDSVMDHVGVECATVVGNSMGGFAGADLAVNFPHRVERLVLVSAAALWNERRVARPLVALAELTQASTARFMARWEVAHRRPRLRLPALAQAGIRHPRRIPLDLAYEVMCGAGAPGFTDALRALYDHQLRQDLERIGCPTLVVWGTHDPLVPLRHAFEYDALIPDSRVAVLDDCGHMAMVERPDAFNDMLDRFVTERPLEKVVTTVVGESA